MKFISKIIVPDNVLIDLSTLISISKNIENTIHMLNFEIKISIIVGSAS